jgi:SAM-dependent methyltransferase
MSATMSSESRQTSLVRVPCPVCGGRQARYERHIRGYALERCRGCGMVFVNPQLPAPDLTQEYQERGDPEGLIAWYERVTTPAKLHEFDQILEGIEKVVPARGRLLDFGCGPAYFIEHAGGRGWEAHGVELGAWAEEAARRRNVSHFHRGLLARQHFPDGWFDVVCAQQVLEHLPDPARDLAEIRRVLRPGGVFYVNVPNYRCLSILLGRDDFELNWPMEHVNYFQPRTLRRLLERCGFEVCRISTFGGIKWENILGRPTQSDEARARRGEPVSPGPPTRAATSRPPRPSLVKRLLLPVVRTCLYRWAGVGINLEASARKP